MQRIKMVVVALFAFALLATAIVSGSASVPSSAPAQEFDAAATFKAKCAMCHGQKAEKKFDPTKPEDVHVNITLKGKDDVTPKMPGYEAKGITAEQAKALVVFMKSQRQ